MEDANFPEIFVSKLSLVFVVSNAIFKQAITPPGGHFSSLDTQQVRLILLTDRRAVIYLVLDMAVVFQVPWKPFGSPELSK